MSGNLQSVSEAASAASLELLGVQIDAVPVEAVHALIADTIQRDEKAIVSNVNAHGLNLAYRSSELRDFLNAAELNFIDGFGVIFAARLLGHRDLPPRITYADWIWQLGEFAEQNGFSFYFLGAYPGIAQAAADALAARFPALEIVGVHHGFFDKTTGSTENEAIVRQINEAQPDILVVGFGMPVQEQWLAENWPRLKAHIALTGGAVFDYASGNVKRAPAWLTDNGFEWLGRLLIEPGRLWRRYVVGNPLFLWRVLKDHILHPSREGR